MREEWEQDSNAAVEEALNRYPEAREFLPLITASTVDEFESVASAIASKVRNIQSKGATSQPSSPPRNPKPKSESIQDAIQNRSWSDYLKAKWESQEDDRA